MTTLWYWKKPSDYEDGSHSVNVTETSSYAYLEKQGTAPAVAGTAPAGSAAPAFAGGAVPAHETYHIVEEPGAIDWRNETEVPTEEYYGKQICDGGIREQVRS